MYFLKPLTMTVVILSILCWTCVISASSNKKGLTTVRHPILLPSRLDGAVRYASSLPRIRSFLIVQDGSIIAEQYFNGAEANQAHNVKSVAKSILSALTGIAINQGYLNIDDQIYKYLSEYYPPEAGSLKKQITVKHLLTMSSGLQSASRQSYYDWHSSHNWLKSALAMEMQSDPGKKCTYSTSDTHLLSAVVSKAIKEDLLAFGRKQLFDPAKIELSHWDKDPQGFYFGGNDLYMTPRNLAKFGQLYLENGKAGRKQIIPAKWVKASTSYAIKPDLWSPFDIRGYGYLWWLLSIRGYDAIAAWGHAGQYLLLFPELNMVIVITSDPNAGYSKKYYKQLAKLINTHIIDAAIERVAEDNKK